MIGAQVTDFGCVLAIAAQQDKLLVSRLAGCEIKQFVLVFRDLIERSGTERVAKEFIAALAHRIFRDQKQTLVVGGPQAEAAHTRTWPRVPSSPELTVLS